MKKLFLCLLLFAVLLMPIVAMAEGELPTVVPTIENELPVDPFSWAQLATIAGATLATVLIVQLLKLPLDKVWKIPTRIVVYIISLIVLMLATYFTSGLTANTALLTAINAVIVALSAMGAYEVTFHKLEEKHANAVAELDVTESESDE